MARNGQPDRRNSWSSLTIHWAIVQNHRMSSCPAMPPIPGRYGENASGQQVGFPPTFSIATESHSCLFSCPGRENSLCVGTGSYVAGCPDGCGSSHLPSPSSSARSTGGSDAKDAATHRHPTVSGRHLASGRPTPPALASPRSEGWPAQTPMTHGACDPGLGNSRHPPASTLREQGWARREPK